MHSQDNSCHRPGWLEAIHTRLLPHSSVFLAPPPPDPSSTPSGPCTQTQGRKKQRPQHWQPPFPLSPSPPSPQEMRTTKPSSHCEVNLRQQHTSPPTGEHMGLLQSNKLPPVAGSKQLQSTRCLPTHDNPLPAPAFAPPLHAHAPCRPLHPPPRPPCHAMPLCAPCSLLLLYGVFAR